MSALTDDPGTGSLGQLLQLLLGAGCAGFGALGGAPWWAMLGSGLLIYMIGTVRVLLVTKMETGRDVAVAMSHSQDRRCDLQTPGRRARDRRSRVPTNQLEGRRAVQAHTMIPPSTPVHGGNERSGSLVISPDQAYSIHHE